MSTLLLTALVYVHIAYGAESACNVGWFGTTCQYMCHCTDNKCNTTTGVCDEGASCMGGWFGPSCQYQDLVMKSSNLKQISSSLTDGDDESCDKNAINYVQLTWQIEYQISWIRIVYRAPGLLSNMSLKLGQNICENLKINIVDNSTTDIYCYVDKLHTNLTLAWSEGITICSIYVNGGRNVALNQTAVQSSTYLEKDNKMAQASNAVDGKTNSEFNDGSCTHTAVDPIPPWPQWNVSFSSPQLVHRYVLYNRKGFEYRLRGFKLQSYSASNSLVYNYTEGGNNLSIYNVTTVGKEVSHVTINATEILTLCEVEIYGERICAPGYFGLDCDQQCRCSDTSETCMSITGGCLSGCLSGYYGQGCQMDCPAARWGVDCIKTCSPFCRYPEHCSSTNGSCDGGCQAGYGGPTCIDECPAGRWGENCANTCSEHCANASECDKRTGNCSSGCSAGYLGDMCDMECDNLTFGLNCLENCSINCGGDGKCDIVSGYCLQGCKSKYGGDVCDQLIQENATESVAIIIPVVLVAIITVLIIGAVVILLKRKKIKEKSVETPDKVLDNRRSLETTHSAGETVNAKVLNKSSDNEVKIENKYVLIESIDGSIAAHQLAAFLHTRDKGYFDEQFKNIPAPENVSTAIGLSEKNKHKNRYKNICTYDHSRVHLDINEKKNEGDYINASYIQGNNSEEKFIASQGPNSIIINDFVRMLWEQKVDKVVMLTNLIEEGKVKCDRYWPEDGKMMFGDIKVKLAVTHVYADYTIRRLLLSKKGTDVQQVTQFHFTSWPDKGVPITPWALVDFEQRVAFNPTIRPVVVHCSAGVGRTGTFIALRNVMREAEETGRVNFLQTVARLRQDRMNMVQTAEQYEFLHKAAQVAITCIGTTITAYDVDVKVQHLLDRSVSGKTNLENEFNSVCAVSADLQTAGKVEEKELKVYENNQDVDLMRKNRCPEIMPNRLYQAKLSRSRPEDSDYINAVVFPSFTKLDHQLLTQLPLPTTVEDFWRLIVEYNVTLVVVFDMGLVLHDKTLGHYLPASVNEMLNIRDYTVELKSSNTHTLWEGKTVVVRTMGSLQLKSFNTQDGHTVLHLQSKLTTLDTKTLLQFIKQTRKHSNKKGKVLYMCRDGATYSGLVCVLNLLLDRMDNDLRLTVPLVVGAVKSIRPQVIPTLQQYHCLYQVLQRYSDTTTTYSNFEKKSEKLIQHLDNNVDDNFVYANTE